MYIILFFFIQSLQIDGNFGKTLPLVIFGTFALLAALLALILPETLNRSLPDSIKDAEDFGKFVPRRSVPMNSTTTN